MRSLILMLMKYLPGATRYFMVSNVHMAHIETGLSTLIRKRGGKYSYLYHRGEMEGEIERIPESSFFWGPWKSGNMRKHVPVVREVDELESFILIRRAIAGKEKVKG